MEKFPTDRAASLGSVPEPQACAQEQLAAFEASLPRVNTQMPFFENEAYKQALQARVHQYSSGAMADMFPDQGGELSVAMLMCAALETKLLCWVSYQYPCSPETRACHTHALLMHQFWMNLVEQAQNLNPRADLD